MEKRRAQVAELYLKGWTQWEIARKVKVDQGTVSRDLKAMHEHWKAAGVRDLDAIKQKELDKIDHLERTYWAAWDRSCKTASKTRKKRNEITEQVSPDEKVTRTAGPVEITEQKEGRDGNPAFLAGVQWCINRRCELLGLDKPKRVVHGGDPDGAPIETKSKIELDLSKLNADELRTLRDLRTKLVGAGESRNGHHSESPAL